MGFKNARSFCLIVVFLLFPLLLAGCNRSATEADPTKTPGGSAAETPSQSMATPVPATAIVDASGVEATAEVVVATEEAQQPEATVEAAATPETPVVEPTQPPAAEQTYTVAAGDTLFSIAQRYGVTVEELAARNGIVNVHRIEVGQVLVIPAAGSQGGAPATGETIHIVQAGENLFRISLRYNMSFETVAAYNGIPWPYFIYPGQQIRIPSTQ